MCARFQTKYIFRKSNTRVCYIQEHRMTRIAGPDCTVMCNLIKYIYTHTHARTHTHTHTH